jgi:hypothetical protein
MTVALYDIGQLVRIIGAASGRDGEWEVRYSWHDSMGQHYTLARPGTFCTPNGGVVVSQAELEAV